jgi:hypothetical protein
MVKPSTVGPSPWRITGRAEPLRHPPPPHHAPFLRRRPGPDALEVRVAEGVLQTGGLHRALAADAAGALDVDVSAREEGLDASAGTRGLLVPLRALQEVLERWELGRAGRLRCHQPGRQRLGHPDTIGRRCISANVRTSEEMSLTSVTMTTV